MRKRPDLKRLEPYCFDMWIFQNKIHVIMCHAVLLIALTFFFKSQAVWYTLVSWCPGNNKGVRQIKKVEKKKKPPSNHNIHSRSVTFGLMF